MKNSIEPEIFVKEISMCRDLSEKNGGRCNWGECDRCGVIPLLYKLNGGGIVEKKDEIEELKRVSLRGS